VLAEERRDHDDPSLRQGRAPNGGVVTNIGSLGVTLAATRDGGFDIAARGTA